MSWKWWMVLGAIGMAMGAGSRASAGDIKITVPKRSHVTPVQRLNQEGVDAIRKRSYEKAETLFYKAYLLDPDDPFTLNNLGYISELKGQVDRALHFYELARQGASDAVVDRASVARVRGHSIKEALAVGDTPIEVNQENVQAVRLLSQGRGPEADLLLQGVLKSDPNNVFTLNNLGVAKEMEGDAQGALKYYDAAAAVHSDASAVVTLSRSWRGKPVSEIAADNAKSVRSRMANPESPEVRVAELNIRGVSALNRNDVSAADEAFRRAYELDPNNAFAINNIGYLAEMEGDRESAEFYYEKAQARGGANLTVGLATRRTAEGSKLFQVASESDLKVQDKVRRERDSRRAQREPIVLRRRDNSVVEEPEVTPGGAQQQSPQ